MTDQEIIYKAISEVVNTDKPSEFAAHNSTCYTIAKYVCEEMRKQLTSLPTEQPSANLEENIEEKINEYWNEWFSHGEYFEGTLPKNVFAAYCHKIAQWQKEQTINKASQWLNENVVEYHPRKGELRPIVNTNAFREAMED